MFGLFYWSSDFKKLKSNAKSIYGWYPLSFCEDTLSVVGFCVDGSDLCKVVIVDICVDGGDEKDRTLFLPFCEFEFSDELSVLLRDRVGLLLENP